MCNIKATRIFAQVPSAIGSAYVNHRISMSCVYNSISMCTLHNLCNTAVKLKAGQTPRCTNCKNEIVAPSYVVILGLRALKCFNDWQHRAHVILMSVPSDARKRSGLRPTFTWANHAPRCSPAFALANHPTTLPQAWEQNYPQGRVLLQGLGKGREWRRFRCSAIPLFRGLS